MPEVSAKIAGLSSNKRALLSRMLKQSGERPGELPLRRLSPPARPPLSFSQQRLWFINQLDPASYLYNVPRAVRLEGTLNFSALEQSLNKIVQRHEVLRTTFPAEFGNPVVQIASELIIAVERHEKPALTLDAAILEEYRRPFDLANGPLLRACLWPLGEERHVLLLVMHHIVSDGFTGGILFEELGTLYQARCANLDAFLPALPIQYSDYAAWQRDCYSGAVLDDAVSDWRAQLKDAVPLLELPTDRDRPDHVDYRGAAPAVTLSPALSIKFRQFCVWQGVTLFTGLLAVLKVLLSKWSGSSDIVVGTVSANRNQTEVEKLIGCFVNFLPLRTRMDGNDTIVETLGNVNATVAKAFTHQDCPFEKLVEAINPERILQANPLYNVALVMQNFPEIAFRAEGLDARFLEVNTGVAFLDLRFVIAETADAIRVTCEYRTGLFEPETIDLLLSGFAGIAEQLVTLPLKTDLHAVKISSELTRQAEARRIPEERICLAATFTAEPVAESIAFWIRKLRRRPHFEFAPYNQVFQQLLDPESRLAKNTNGVNIILLRLEDWAGDTTQSAAASLQAIERSAADFVAAIKSHAANSASTQIVSVCPASQDAVHKMNVHGALSRIEERFATDLNAIPKVDAVTSSRLLELYPISDYEDSFGAELGAIPYTAAFFIALGSMLARRLQALRAVRRKVVALDCDGTLWRGVCAEAGATGVRVDEPFRALQAFFIKQHEEGMLLCLSSKNSPGDVAAVFEQNPEMLLRRKHIASERINWRAKSENLKDLAKELNLGLDSFIFVDDNPIECAEVRAGCPEVLVLELPPDAERTPTYLKHVWAFDHWKLTQQDGKRNESYRLERERNAARNNAVNLGEFLAGLELKIDIRSPRTDEMARISQLTERTSQFSCSGLRFSEEAIGALLAQQASGLVAEVKDRFGDYGLVGLALFHQQGDVLEADVFLLSCRALGRRVEHHMLAELAKVADTRGLQYVGIRYLATSRNEPARQFLENIYRLTPGSEKNGAYRFPLCNLAALAPTDIDALATDPIPASGQRESKPGESFRPAALLSLMPFIASHLSTVDDISYSIESEKSSVSQNADSGGKPRTLVEEILAGIWKSLLRVESFGRRDNFFRLGGHSLLAAQVVARIRHSLKVELPLRSLFEAPTIAGLAEAIEAELRFKTGMILPPLAKRVLADSYPLSFAQQRLWFLDQLEPGTSFYNIPQRIRLRGSLDVGALAQSVNEIVRRHESLRTVFTVRDGQPVQVVKSTCQIVMAETDLQSLGEAERAAEAERVLATAAESPFDLIAGPLLRVHLVRLHEQECILLFCLHHIVSDRWSMGVFAEELTSLYSAFARNAAPTLPELRIQYADYSVWQRAWLRDQALDSQVSYWRNKLEGAPALLELLTDRPRPAVQTHQGALVERLISATLIRSATVLGQAEGATLFMTLLAAFQALLGRMSRQEDVVVGSPIAGRSHTEAEPLIGFFVNTVALRADLSGGIGFRKLLAQVKKTAIDAYTHQDVPFEKLVEELEPERSLSHNPIFQVLFALQNAPMQTVRLPGLELERERVYSNTAVFDLSCFAIETADGDLLLRAEYASDLFDSSTIVRMLAHFETFLESALAQPDQAVSKLLLLKPDEAMRQAADLNRTGRDYPKGERIHDFLARQAQSAPHNVALVSGERRISFAELNSLANQIAHFLIKRGAGPDVLIGIYVERTPEMVAAILGVLKAGSAYVPLDPKYPKERLAYILEDSEPRLILTQASLLGDLSGFRQDLVCLDRDWPDIRIYSIDDPITAVQPHHLAYVLFTSGSTGRPKGVALEHRSAVTFIRWVNETMMPAELAGVLFCTSICFDMSTFEMFVTIAAGGKIILAENPLELPELAARDEVTLINTVPSAIAELVRTGALPPSVKTLALAGEALPQALVSEIYASTAVENVYNLYGPTENGYSTSARIDRDKSVTIGRPIANCQAYVLDTEGSIVPIGVSGELFLAGDGLARGYYRRPDLTAERFVENRFSSETGARMYRTGDLCRWLPSGELQYFGRLDHQVKLRGFRIELAEIEATLDRHPAVRQSVVMVREDVPGSQSLVAYVTLEPEVARGSSDLREDLKLKLPDFMIPAGIVVLDAFPLTPNGKIDRKALPLPEHAGTESTSQVEPATRVEFSIASIWAEVLRLPRVGRTDNFFALGGHSLLAAQVISRIREKFEIELPLRAIFQSPTLSELAAEVEKAQLTGRVRKLPTLLPVSRDEPLPLSFAQQRLWFLDQLEPDNPFYNIPCSLRAAFEIDAESLERALNTLIARHESLRTRFIAVDGQAQQVIASKLDLTVTIADFRSLAASECENEAKLYVDASARRPFDLAGGPLVRADLLRLTNGENILLLNVHHIVSDRWSMNVLLSEFTTVYRALVRGDAPVLPDLPVQYADFAVWQRNSLSGSLYEEQFAYWKNQLAGAPPVLDLPTDFPRPAVETFRGDAVSVSFGREWTEGVQKLAQRCEATLFMTLLAGFQALLVRYTGQDDFVVGTPVASRNHPDLEPLIGFFTNTLALRARLCDDPAFSDMIARAKETALEAYANQDLPFEKLVEELHPERSLSRNPLIQVFFVLQNAPEERLALDALGLRHVETDTKTAKGDLFLSMAQTEKGLTGRLEYNTDLFEGKTIERLWGHYRSLLAGAVADASRRLSELPLLSGNERQQLLAGWNETAVEYERSLCLHEWFERQVAERPSALACIWDEGALSYAELNERANQLAHCLRRQGAKPGERVGVFLERSAQLLVALLGIQKSGAAYVPVDPAYPAERIRQIWEQAQIKVLVTEAGIADSLALGAACARILLDTERSALERESGENLTPSAKAGDAVYVIFTSGSTGRPKGVEVPHRAVVNLLASMAQELRLGPGEVFPALASVAFDMCIPELYLALVTGGTVALGRAGLAADGVELAAFLQRVGATVVHATPTTWRLLLDAGFTGAGLKRAIGAEALPPEVCRRLLAAEPSLYNFYGPTETTVWSTVHHFQSAEEEVVIGRPLANTRIYILDRGQQPVPIGIEGELYIGGAGVANGYLGQPELTAERFLADPFCAGGRMYRTGDRARYRADGRIEYRGRGDLQVKLRGYRIELGEVEAVLTQHGGVAQCVAAVREETPGDQRLVAYVVAQPGSPLPEAALRSWVKERLPEYMVPVRIVEVERFALTPNGKVDRGQLAGVSYQREGAAAESQAARTPLEEVVGGIWAEVLKLERVGMEEDFFQLGGHSLLGTQVVSRIRQAAAVELPLRALFEAPTVRGLAQRVAELRQGGGGRLRPALERLPRPERVPLSLAQQRLWFLDQLEPGNVLYNVPYLVRLSGPLEAAVLEQSLQEIVRRHESLRTRFVLCDDEPAQLIDGAWELKLERVALAPGPAADRLSEARRLVLAQIQQPFHLAQGPLLRASLYELAADDHVFLLNTHHIVSDRWSLGVLAEELAALYAAYREGKPSPLAALPVQYADYALWQRACLTDAVLAPQLAFWKKHLDGAPAFLNLPTDRARSVQTESFWGGIHTHHLAPELVAELRDLSRKQQVTFFMTLLAGFNLLMQHVSGQDDVVIGTDLANRTDVNTEGLIGFFVNLLPVRTSLSENQTISELLAQIREVSLGVHANQEVPFDRLVEELKPERIPGRHPLVQVLFVMQNTPQVTRSFGGLTIGPVGVTSRSRFDLVLFVNDPEGTPFLTWMYNPRLFEAAEIVRLTSRLEELLRMLAGPSDSTVGFMQQSLNKIKSREHVALKKEFQQASQKKLGGIRRKPSLATQGAE